MSENIIPFEYHGKKVRIVIISGEPWFVAKDVCDILGIERVDSALRALDEDEKGTHKVSTPGGYQNMSVINESGLYSYLLNGISQYSSGFEAGTISSGGIPLKNHRRAGAFSAYRNADSLHSAYLRVPLRRGSPESFGNTVPGKNYGHGP